MLEDLKKLLFDLAKIVFAGVIVNGIMRQNFNPTVTIFSGAAAVFLMLAGAFGISWYVKHLKNK